MREMLSCSWKYGSQKHLFNHDCFIFSDYVQDSFGGFPGVTHCTGGGRLLCIKVALLLQWHGTAKTADLQNMGHRGVSLA